MKSEVNTILTFGNGEKWLVAAVTNYQDKEYCYLVKVNDNEDDFLDDYKIVETEIKGGNRYMHKVEDNTILNIVSILLLPEAKAYIAHPEYF